MACQPAMRLEEKSPHAEAQPGLENLFRRLLDLFPETETGSAAPISGSRSEIQEGEEIIYDVILDGAHYLLIRISRPAGPRVRLSPREQEIVRMVAQGHPNKIIADVLNISCWTVSTHLRRIFAKLGVTSRAAMVARMMDAKVARRSSAHR